MSHHKDGDCQEPEPPSRQNRVRFKDNENGITDSGGHTRRSVVAVDGSVRASNRPRIDTNKVTPRETME